MMQFVQPPHEPKEEKLFFTFSDGCCIFETWDDTTDEYAYTKTIYSTDDTQPPDNWNIHRYNQVDQIKHLNNEVKILKQLKSKIDTEVGCHNILQVRGVAYSDDTPTILLEQLDGIITQQTTYNHDRLVWFTIVQDVFRGLKYIHENGVVHKNITNESIAYKKNEKKGECTYLITNFGQSVGVDSKLNGDDKRGDLMDAANVMIQLAHSFSILTKAKVFPYTYKRAFIMKLVPRKQWQTYECLVSIAHAKSEQDIQQLHDVLLDLLDITEPQTTTGKFTKLLETAMGDEYSRLPAVIQHIENAVTQTQMNKKLEELEKAMRELYSSYAVIPSLFAFANNAILLTDRLRLKSSYDFLMALVNALTYQKYAQTSKKWAHVKECALKLGVATLKSRSFWINGASPYFLTIIRNFLDNTHILPARSKSQTAPSGSILPADNNQTENLFTGADSDPGVLY
jgi:serine/threonine protein kinase